jgi:hypothetical protein
MIFSSRSARGSSKVAPDPDPREEKNEYAAISSKLKTGPIVH